MSEINTEVPPGTEDIRKRIEKLRASRSDSPHWWSTRSKAANWTSTPRAERAVMLARAVLATGRRHGLTVPDVAELLELPGPGITHRILNRGLVRDLEVERLIARAEQVLRAFGDLNHGGDVA